MQSFSDCCKGLTVHEIGLMTDRENIFNNVVRLKFRSRYKPLFFYPDINILKLDLVADQLKLFLFLHFLYGSDNSLNTEPGHIG